MHYNTLALALLMTLSYVWAHVGSSHDGLHKHTHKARKLGSTDKHAKKPIASAWLAGWVDVHPANIDWTKFDVVRYAFATTTKDPSVLDLSLSNEGQLTKVVEEAHKNHVKVVLSMGGWTGSKFFSSAVASPESRTTFVKASIGLVNKFKVDGLDFDWEFMNKQGIGCNELSPKDSENFLSFLVELRQDPVGKSILLSADGSLTPFLDSTGSPMKDVSAFAKVLDHIIIMPYDVWGPWSTSVGPNSPLNDTCAPSQNQQGSAASAVVAWTTANFPIDKIILGLAAYGHSYYVTNADALSPNGKLKPYPPFDKHKQPPGDSQDEKPGGKDQCGQPTTTGGIFNFWGLIQAGFLNTEGSAPGGIDYRFDSCSQTAYVYNPSTNVMVSFDDAKAFIAKGKYICDSGLAGFSMWTLDGDSNSLLVDAARKGMGIK